MISRPNWRRTVGPAVVWDMDQFDSTWETPFSVAETNLVPLSLPLPYNSFSIQLRCQLLGPLCFHPMLFGGSFMLLTLTVGTS